MVIISAVICTYNRASYLEKSIDSLSEQVIDNSLYEILVVDNNSTDETHDLVASSMQSIANLRYVLEPIQGLSHARNTALENAKGKYIAYLDDDAIAHPSWLANLIKGFQNLQPCPGCIGGKVEPIWEVPRPSWLHNRLLPFLTIIDWSTEPIFLEDNRYIAGANMAFPIELLREVGGFDLSLGRKGKKLLSNEELALQTKISDQGYSIYYDPEIAVRHHIPEQRLTQKWLKNRKYWQGVSNAHLLLSGESGFLGERLKLAAREIKGFLKHPKQFLLLFSPTDDAEIFYTQCSRLEKIGYITSLLGMI